MNHKKIALGFVNELEKTGVEPKTRHAILSGMLSMVGLQTEVSGKVNSQKEFIAAMAEIVGEIEVEHKRLLESILRKNKHAVTLSGTIH